ncbi:hypothetical protein COMNV_00775 [Commensalibacter sp. Nvir]|uniref:hypothetical protein n=1 Tax=Commensalibacter sp. Nvir TaxID=3069817 RepID=UPI002D600EF3|nr:hypothetical protein COMNV_00775 [Commensalibacter sp. Nvir]
MKKGYGLVVFTFLVGCAAPKPESLQLVDMPVLQLRTIQSQQFKQQNNFIAMQAVVKTLSILNFQITRIDESLGLIEAIQLEKNHITQVEVLVRKDKGNGIKVRINIRADQKVVTNSQVYQRFFESLSKTLE